ncbi:hypothetical protein BT69DRAFT_920148 [Atractiella rhizophila]|nr:hypothetical protein BT69DRAFT_920148 [Atractiella rhizophila]
MRTRPLRYSLRSNLAHRQYEESNVVEGSQSPPDFAHPMSVYLLSLRIYSYNQHHHYSLQRRRRSRESSIIIAVCAAYTCNLRMFDMLLCRNKERVWHSRSMNKGQMVRLEFRQMYTFTPAIGAILHPQYQLHASTK